MITKITAIILMTNYLCAAPALSTNPQFEFGTKFTKFNTCFVRWQEPGQELWILENYFGLNAEFSLCLLNNLFFRLETIEFRKYQYTGKTKIMALSNLNMDIEYQIPIRTSLKPLVYFGIKYRPTAYCSNLDVVLDYMFHQEFHFGCGIALPLGTNFKIVFENHLYTDSKWWWWSEDIWYCDHIQTWGFERLSLGLRYTLGNLIK
ncbi:MAG: hypothetical protein ABIL40_11105 [candidate division WOR-3 bacterium]